MAKLERPLARRDAQIPDRANVAEQAMNAVLRDDLNSVIDQLSLRQKRVLHWLGILSVNGRTPVDLRVTDVAKRQLGVSPTRVGQLRNRGLDRLERIAAARGLREYLHPVDTVDKSALLVKKPEVKKPAPVSLTPEQKARRRAVEAEYLGVDENRKKVTERIDNLRYTGRILSDQVVPVILRLGRVEDFSFGKIPFKTTTPEDFVIAILRQHPVTIDTVIERLLVRYNRDQVGDFLYFHKDKKPQYLYWDRNMKKLLPIE